MSLHVRLSLTITDYQNDTRALGFSGRGDILKRSDILSVAIS